MITWINGTTDGELAPSLMYPNERAAQRALGALLALARSQGRSIGHESVADVPVWTVRDERGTILRSWWLSEHEHGPALRHFRRA